MDHKKEAERLIEKSNNWGDTLEERALTVAQAQVHATLALAEGK